MHVFILTSFIPILKMSLLLFYANLFLCTFNLISPQDYFYSLFNVFDHCFFSQIYHWNFLMTSTLLHLMNNFLYSLYLICQQHLLWMITFSFFDYPFSWFCDTYSRILPTPFKNLFAELTFKLQNFSWWLPRPMSLILSFLPKWYRLFQARQWLPVN